MQGGVHHRNTRNRQDNREWLSLELPFRLERRLAARIVEGRNGELVRALIDDEFQPTHVTPIVVADTRHVLDGTVSDLDSAGGTLPGHGGGLYTALIRGDKRPVLRTPLPLLKMRA
jgi:hypothetical protein